MSENYRDTFDDSEGFNYEVKSETAEITNRSEGWFRRNARKIGLVTGLVSILGTADTMFRALHDRNKYGDANYSDSVADKLLGSLDRRHNDQSMSNAKGIEFSGAQFIGLTGSILANVLRPRKKENGDSKN